MPFLPPNQQRQSTEGTCNTKKVQKSTWDEPYSSSTKQSCSIIMINVMNEYYFSAVESKKLQEHLTVVLPAVAADAG